MKKLNTILLKLGGLFAAFALMLGVASTTAMCIIFYHQPIVPVGIEKFKIQNKS